MKSMEKLVNLTRAYNCFECGKCRATCPISRFDEEYSPRSIVERALLGLIDYRSKIIWYCMGCGACEDVCPSGVDYTGLIMYLRAEAIRSRMEGRLAELEGIFLEGEMNRDVGIIREITAGKAEIEGQDGGIVTSLLTKGTEKGLFDISVVVHEDNDLVKVKIAENISDITKAKGSKYQLARTVKKLVEAIMVEEKRKIAIVGMPCEVFGVREIQKNLLDLDMEITVIGLFCMENFVHEALKEKLKDILQIDLDQAEKVDIKRNEFIIYDGEKRSCKVDELRDVVRRNCNFCTDFTARLADISVGSVGSPDGYSTIIVRSKRGEELLQSVDKFEKAEVNRKEIAKLESLKKRISLQRLERFAAEVI